VDYLFTFIGLFRQQYSNTLPSAESMPLAHRPPAFDNRKRRICVAKRSQSFVLDRLFASIRDNSKNFGQISMKKLQIDSVA